MAVTRRADGEETAERARADLFLLQMAGPMGSGKSTLARRIGRATGAVVLDLDVVKSAALASAVEWDLAGRTAYRALHDVAASLLAQNLRVVLDSPCRHPFIVERGQDAAAAHGAVYCYLECALADPGEHRRRLHQRPRLRSQGLDWDAPPPDAPRRTYDDPTGTLWDSHHPDVPWRRVDTAQPVDACLAEALAYLAERLGG